MTAEAGQETIEIGEDLLVMFGDNPRLQDQLSHTRFYYRYARAERGSEGLEAIFEFYDARPAEAQRGRRAPTERHQHKNLSGWHEYRALLRITSDQMRLGELTAILGKATQSYDVGDERFPGGGVLEETFWGFEAPIERTQPLDEHLEPVLGFAEANQATLDNLRERGCSIDISCDLYSEHEAFVTWVFTPTLSRRIAELGLPVTFHQY